MKDFPEKCPHCEKDVVPHQLGILPDIYEPNAKSYDMLVEVHECIHCFKPFFLVKELDEKASVRGIYKTAYIVPPSKSADYPKQVEELSKNAFEFYKQAIQANDLALDKLVGAGLRAAVEWLIWDYLIKLKGFKSYEMEDKTLKKRIDLIKDDNYKNVCADIVRLFGNDSVHIIKQVDFKVDEAILSYKTLITLIDQELTLKELEKRKKQNT